MHYPRRAKTITQSNVGAEHRSALKHERYENKGIIVLCPYNT